jgi:hypothetical protein
MRIRTLENPRSRVQLLYPYPHEEGRGAKDDVQPRTIQGGSELVTQAHGKLAREMGHEGPD